MARLLATVLVTGAGISLTGCVTTHGSVAAECVEQWNEAPLPVEPEARDYALVTTNIGEDGYNSCGIYFIGLDADLSCSYNVVVDSFVNAGQCREVPDTAGGVWTRYAIEPDLTLTPTR